VLRPPRLSAYPSKTAILQSSRTRCSSGGQAAGRPTSTARTPEQTEIASSAGANDVDGTYKAPGQLFDVTKVVSRQKNLDLADSARLFALVALVALASGCRLGIADRATPDYLGVVLGEKEIDLRSPRRQRLDREPGSRTSSKAFKRFAPRPSTNARRSTRSGHGGRSDVEDADAALLGEHESPAGAVTSSVGGSGSRVVMRRPRDGRRDRRDRRGGCGRCRDHLRCSPPSRYTGAG
jgi:hypothetical protein